MSVVITWYDNAAFKFEYKKKIVWFDPSLDKNPDSPIRVSDVDSQADYVLTTHGDPGHFINSVAIAKKTGAYFVASEELCNHVLKNGQLDRSRLIPVSFNELKTIGDMDIFMFEALHPTQSESTLQIIAKYGGVQTRNAGFVVKIDSLSVCHMGDATYSSIYKTIKDEFNINIGMIPIQGAQHGDPNLTEAVSSGANIIQDLRLKTVLPVIQYTKQQDRIAPLKDCLLKSHYDARIIFDAPGTRHIIKS